MAKIVFKQNCSYDREHLQNISYQLDVLIKMVALSQPAQNTLITDLLRDYVKNTEK